MKVETLTQILDYAHRGMPVIPIHSITPEEDCTCNNPECSSPGKHPRTRKGVHDATTDENQIRTWAKQFPSCNWAVATGSRSGIFVVDIDPRNGGDTAFTHLVNQHEGIPKSPAINTGGGGWHLYFKHPADIPVKNRSIAPGVDIKTEGGYVLVPPSTTDKVYRWMTGKSLDDIPLPELPKWILEKAQGSATGNAEISDDAEVSEGSIPEGQRNTTLTSLAGSMQRRGMTLEAIEAALLAENTSRCHPPLEDSEVRQIVRSVSRYEPDPQVPERTVVASRPELRGFTALELLQLDFPEPTWIIPEILPEGLGILAGKPKIGKSWMALAYAIAISSGGKVLGEIDVVQGEVLYLALEDNPRRLSSRLEQLLQGTSASNILHLFTDWPRLDEGGLDMLATWMQDHPNTRLIIVDTFAKVRPKKRGRNSYDDDYRVLSGIKELADRHAIAVLVIHHLRKQSADDPFDEISGTTGFTGAADSLGVLRRDGSRADAILHVRGRDVEEASFALKFDKHLVSWFILGDAEDYQRSRERQDIVDILRSVDDLMGPTEIADVLGKTEGSVKYLLSQMLRSGAIVKLARGQYTVPEKADLLRDDYDLDNSPNLTDSLSSKESMEDSKVRTTKKAA